MSGSKPPRPWPVQPLLDAIGADTVSGCAFRAGIQPRALTRAIERGGFTDETADRYAVMAGFHPAEVWGWDAWWRSGITPLDDQSINGTCPGWRPAWLWGETEAEPCELGEEAA